MSLWKAVAEGQSHRYPIPGKGKGFGSVAALAPLDLRKQLWDGRKQLAQQLDRQQTPQKVWLDYTVQLCILTVLQSSKQIPPLLTWYFGAYGP